MTLDVLPAFVAAVAEHIPDGWTLHSPRGLGTSSRWWATAPGFPSGRSVGIVNGPAPSVDCRKEGVELARYQLAPGQGGAFLPDVMLERRVFEMCRICAPNLYGMWP